MDLWSLGRGCVALRSAQLHKFGVDDEPENDGKKGEGGGGDEGEAIVLLREIDQVSYDRAKGHDSKSNEHVESRVKLGEVLLWKHSQGEGCGASEPST